MEQYTIPPEERAHLLALLTMAWDRQWFLKIHDEYGWEEAARLNTSVRAAFGRIEMRRMLRTLGKRAADDLEDVQVAVRRTRRPRCERCWNFRDTVGQSADHDDLCDRCSAVVSGQ